jgi:hypothetical protein
LGTDAGRNRTNDAHSPDSLSLLAFHPAPHAFWQGIGFELILIFRSSAAVRPHLQQGPRALAVLSD